MIPFIFIVALTILLVIGGKLVANMQESRIIRIDAERRIGELIKLWEKEKDEQIKLSSKITSLIKPKGDNRRIINDLSACAEAAKIDLKQLQDECENIASSIQNLRSVFIPETLLHQFKLGVKPA